MATWNKNAITSTTKIREAGALHQANYNAIEEGDDTLKVEKWNFTNRDTAGLATPPTRVDNTMQFFAQDNDDTKTDLYVIDDRNPANVIELTENGKLGGRSQSFVIGDFSFGTNTTTYDAGNIIKARGTFDTTNTTISFDNGDNMAAGVRISKGKFTVTVNADVLDDATDYQVMVTPHSSSGSARSASIISKGVVAAGNPVTIQVGIYEGSNLYDTESFDIIVMGGV